jgi:NADP-dependent 3-hydroxy acid dehydrogenase YdfG
VVNIGSVAGHQLYPGGNVYCASKFAVRAISEGMRIDLLGTHVRVTSIDPGMVETAFSEVRFHGDEKRAAQVYANFSPLQASDVADTVLYCVTRPPHVDVAEVLLMPTDQGSVNHLHRTPEK